MDALVLLAAGESRRYGGNVSKILRRLAGKPLIVRALAPFLVGVERMALVIAARPADRAALKRILPRANIVDGGASRGASLAQAVKALPAGVEMVLIHEAARPLASAEVVRRVLAAARRDGAAAPIVPVLDPLHHVGKDDGGRPRLEDTVDRSRLGAAQTPVAVRRELLEGALEAARNGESEPADDVDLLQRGGVAVTAVRGDVKNLRITTPADMDLAEALLRGSD